MIADSLVQVLSSPLGLVAGVVFLFSVAVVVAAARGAVGPRRPQQVAVGQSLAGAALLVAGGGILFGASGSSIDLVNAGLRAVARGVLPTASPTATLGWLLTVGGAGFVGAFVLAGVDAAVRDHEVLPAAEGTILIINGSITCLAVGIGLGYSRGPLAGTAIAGVSITLAVFLLTLGSLLLVIQRTN